MLQNSLLRRSLLALASTALLLPLAASPALAADTVKPTAPTLFEIDEVGVTSVDLTFKASSTDNVGVTGYVVNHVSSSGTVTRLASLGTTANAGGFMSTQVKALQPSYTYRLQVCARDAVGNLGCTAIISVRTWDDLTAPSAPTGVVINSVSATAITATWKAATDNVAVTGYGIYNRNADGTRTLLRSTANLTKTADGLKPLTTYNIVICANDKAGNLGCSTPAIATKTLADTSKPSTPTLSYSYVGPSSITLTWNKASDNVGVASYRVDRWDYDGLGWKLGIGKTTTALTFRFGRLATNFHQYRVCAADAAGNTTCSAVMDHPSGVDRYTCSATGTSTQATWASLVGTQVLPNITVAGNIEKEFLVTARDSLENVPATWIKRFNDAGARGTLFCGYLTEVPGYEWLLSTSPRGYPDGSSFRDVIGVGGWGGGPNAGLGFATDLEQGYCCEWGTGSTNTMLHEMGHTLDAILNYPSGLAEWTVGPMGERKAKFPDGYTNTYPEEWFAEAFALYFHNPATYNKLKLDYPKSFQSLQVRFGLPVFSADDPTTYKNVCTVAGSYLQC